MTATTPLGQVLRDDHGVRLEFVRTYDEPIEGVWSALTEPDRVATWMGTISGDPATGTVEFVMAEHEGGTPQAVAIVECVPPTRLVVVLPSPDGPWQVTVDLGTEGDVTTLVFAQRLVEPYDASSIGPGWHYYLDRLGAVIVGAEVPADWDDYYPALSGAYGLPG